MCLFLCLGSGFGRGWRIEGSSLCTCFEVLHLGFGCLSCMQIFSFYSFGAQDWGSVPRVSGVWGGSGFGVFWIFFGFGDSILRLAIKYVK